MRGNPAATIQIGRHELVVTAEAAGPEERARLWPKVTQMYPGYDAYQAKTSREIPIVILSPGSAGLASVRMRS